MKRCILIVDRGNVLRSPIVEDLLKKRIEKEKLTKNYVVVSRCIQGTSVDTKKVEYPNITYYKDIYQRCKSWLNKNNIDLSKRVSKVIDLKIVDKAEIILALDQKTKKSLLILYPNYSKKIYLLSEIIQLQMDIEDPEEKNKDEIIKILEKIKGIIEKGFSNIIALIEKGN